MEKLNDERIVDACAVHAWETNRLFVWALTPPEGNQAIPTWGNDGPDDEDRMRRMARAVLEEDLTAEDKHQQWVTHMLACGWTRGPGPDAENKKHPMLVPFAELPHTQAMKESLVVASINAMATALGHSRRPMATATVETKKEG